MTDVQRMLVELSMRTVAELAIAWGVTLEVCKDEAEYRIILSRFMLNPDVDPTSHLRERGLAS